MATLVQAIRLALHYGETYLGVTDIFGEDVGPPLGGVFTATQGLKNAWNSPLDERGIVGAAMGIAYAGGRPVFEMQFCDYAFNMIDLLKIAGNQRWSSAGKFDMPIVLMTPTGSGIRGSIYHSHSYESWATRIQGWKVVMPSDPLDAYGLMLSAIVDPNPVMVLLPKALLRVRGERLIPGEPADEEDLKRRIDAPVGDRSLWQPDWPDVKEYFVRIGEAELVREGTAGTILSYGRTLALSRKANDLLQQEEGLSFDVLDLRSLFPYDWGAIRNSVLKTGRVLIVNEDTEVTNFGEHLLRRIVDEHFYDLLVRPRVLQGKHVPGIGMNAVYENNTVPQLKDVREAMLSLAPRPWVVFPTVATEEVPPMDFALPEIGEGVYEAELIRWFIKPGDVVKRGQNLFEVMTDKATMEVPAPFAGTIQKLGPAPGDRIKVGGMVLSYLPKGGVEEPLTVSTSEKRTAVEPAVPSAAGGMNGIAQTAGQAVAVPLGSRQVAAAPSVRHLARKLGIDLGGVQGTGPGGRILLDDLAPHLQRPSGTPAAPASKREIPPDYGKPGTRIKLQGMRRLIAEHMVDSKNRIPHYSYVDEVDITAMVDLRRQLRESCTARGVKLTYLAFFVKAVASALKEIPIVNSSLNEAAGEIVLHDRYNVGVAVATPGGLVVPVIHDVDKRDLLSVAQEVDRLGNAAKEGKIKREDLKGGTFTVTSVGGIGGLISTPIINHPEVGIMGVGKVVKRPVYDDHGDLRPADVVYLSFSFDHRVVDGAVGAAFGNAVINHLKKPSILLLPPL